MTKTLEILKKYFNYDTFRPAQEEIITAIISGKNVLAVLPTGAGKSLCYQLPALLSEGFSIVVSPLIALMKDQVDALNKNGETAAFINSTMSFREADEVLRKVAYGKIKLLYAAPERLENLLFAERIKNLKPQYLFIDEAHCISEWGHNFRPSYTKIKDFIKFTGITKVSAFTATATPEVERDIIKQLDMKGASVFVRGFERDNLNLNVIITQHKLIKCVELIKQFKTPAVIYSSSRRSAEEVNEYLTMNRISSGCYHAGLNPDFRKKIQEDFLNDKISVISATNAFGMGIDKSDIRLIIHYNIPGSIENYYQEIGRAGRDGRPSDIFLLFDERDLDVQKYFIENAYPDKELIQNIYAGICDYSRVAEGILPAKDLPINMEYLSAYAKREISRGLLHSSLNALAQAGYLREISEFDNLTSVRFTADVKRIKNFTKGTANNIIKELVLFLVREYGSLIFSRPVNVSISSLSAQLKVENSDIESALTAIDNLSLAEVNIPVGGINVRLLRERVSAPRLNIDYKRINENYLNQQKKLDLMADYVYTAGCRFKYILNYFGEESGDYKCGRCDKCVVSEKLSDSTTEYVKELVLRTLNSTGGVLTDNSILMVIKGSSKIKRYSSLPTFGGCANYDINDLKHILQHMLSEGLIKKERSGGKVLALDQKGRDILKKIDPALKGQDNDNYEKNLELFNLLSDVRKKASVRFGQSVDLICPNPVLVKIAEARPASKPALFRIEGFNNRMYNKIGEELLETIRQYDTGGITFDEEKEGDENCGTLPVYLHETLNMIRMKKPLSEIAMLRNLSEAVISMQIETVLEYHPETSIDYLFNEGELENIFDEIKRGTEDLKELKQKVKYEVSFPLLRIAAAKFRVLPRHSV